MKKPESSKFPTFGGSKTNTKEDDDEWALDGSGPSKNRYTGGSMGGGAAAKKKDDDDDLEDLLGGIEAKRGISSAAKEKETTP